MKAQTSTLQLAALGGVAASMVFLASRHQRISQPSPERVELDQRIRAGILPTNVAIERFAENACYISEARWLLNAEPFQWWKVAWMGLARDVDFNKKYEHGFVIVYDKDQQPFMALHTMPNDRSDDPLPNAMGDRNCVIDVFAVTMDASDALCKKRGHDQIISEQLLPIDDPQLRAIKLQSYIQAVHDGSFDYTVPIQPVRRELTAALKDGGTLSDFPAWLRPLAVSQRQSTLEWIDNMSDEVLARRLNRATKYRLAPVGFNSNTGAAEAIAELGHNHSLDLIRAPFSDQSMLKELRARAALNAAVNLAPVAKARATKPRRRKPAQSPLGLNEPAFA